MMGNEGEGLSKKQIGMCDQLVYIPQYGSAVSLNVNVAAGIVLLSMSLAGAVWLASRLV